MTGQDPTTGRAAGPRPGLAAEAEVAARNLERSATRRATASGRGPRAAARRAGSGPAARDGGPGSGHAHRARPGSGAASATGTTSGGDGAGSSTSWSTLLAAPDSAADHGGAPGYADLRALTVEDGGRQLRVTLQMGAVVPGRLDDREVQGVGVDLFRGSTQESDYQLFLDGGGHGWRGFLQTPRGFVEFPGSVAVRGSVLSATLPWTALGGRRDGDVAAFVDWADGAGHAGADQGERASLRPS